ncbi:MAG: hypothetical protein ACRDOI_20510 [Trebonia sp.]
MSAWPGAGAAGGGGSAPSSVRVPMSRAAACSGVVLPGVPFSSAAQPSRPERVTLYRAVASRRVS